ncbi:MAG: hypothetical protein Q7K43_00235 [Candidatus Woesearchaeota archaeon]|nr:hypothetical protein [Candidatus Woesearchaeota archaeon]
MREIHLGFLETDTCEVTFYAKINHLVSPGEKLDLTRGRQSFQHQIVTDDTPRRVLDELEQKVFDCIREHASAHDVFKGSKHDADMRFDYHTRKAVYLPEAGWQKAGQTKEQAEEIARRNTCTRNKKLLEIFGEYVKFVTKKH